MESQRIGEPVADRRSLAFGDHSYCRNLLVRSARFPRIITSPLPSHRSCGWSEVEVKAVSRTRCDGFIRIKAMDAPQHLAESGIGVAGMAN